MRTFALIALVSLVACKPAPATTAPPTTPEAQTGPTEDDNWQGFGGNEHPEQTSEPLAESEPEPEPETTPETADPSDPEVLVRQVCEAMRDIVEKEPGLPEEAIRDASDIDKCIAAGREEMEKNPESFTRTAVCIVDEAKRLDDAMACILRERQSQSSTATPQG